MTDAVLGDAVLGDDGAKTVLGDGPMVPVWAIAAGGITSPSPRLKIKAATNLRRTVQVNTIATISVREVCQWWQGNQG